MKRLLGFVFLCVLISGCSAAKATNTVTPSITSAPTPSTSSTIAPSTTSAQTQTLEPSEEILDDNAVNNPTIVPTISPAVDTNEQDKAWNEADQQSVTPTTKGKDNWFTGAIGNAKIHAKFQVDGKEITGVYYYDKYKVNINLSGSMDYYIKDYPAISLDEDTEQEGVLFGIYKSEDYIEGYWKSGSDIYPMYLIKEGSDINPPAKPSKSITKFKGNWKGLHSTYYESSNATITTLFNDMIYYDLSAINGFNIGEVESLAIRKGNLYETVFEERIDWDDDTSDHTRFEFILKNNKLYVKSNNYSFWCGNGVSFDYVYMTEGLDIPVPTALEVGIVETEEQEKIFKNIVGDDYEHFICYTEEVSYENKILDGEKVKAGESFSKGYPRGCYYIISSKYIYAAYNGYDSIVYYTNDPNYATSLPKPMSDWADKDLPVEYHYIK